MPRKSHRATRTLPKYSHHKRSGQALVVLPLDGGRRQYVYLGPYNSRESLEKYDEVVGEWRAKRTGPKKDDGPRLRDLAERYQSYREPVLKPHQRYDLASMVRLVSEMFGERPADEFDAMLCDRFKAGLIARGYSREYGNRILGHVKKLFHWAAQRKLVPVDNYTLVNTVEPLSEDEAPTKDVQPVPQATVDRTLPELSDTLADMVRFIRATGCRPGEARLMKVGDVDRENWLLELKMHKTAHKGKARFVVIHADARHVLLPRLLRPADHYVFSPDAEGSQAYEKRALGRAIDRAVKRINRDRKVGEAELEHWHPYQLRHARAVEVREQFGAEVAQVLLGHSRIDMTQHYAKLTRNKAIEIAKLFGDRQA